MGLFLAVGLFFATQRTTQPEFCNCKSGIILRLGHRRCLHDYHGDAVINIVNSRKMKKMTRSTRHWFKRRSAIEPIIGHLKSDNRMPRNYLKGEEGDRINAILCACGFNMRKLLAVFLCLILKFKKVTQNQLLITKYCSDRVCYVV